MAKRPTGSISVKDHGAVGDGSTNDTTAIQAALASAPEVGTTSEKTIWFPPGDYRVGSDTLYPPFSGVSFKGEGPSSILRMLDEGQGTEVIFTIGPPKNINGQYDPNVVLDDITICDLTLDGNGNDYPSTPGDFFGIHVIHATKLKVERVYFRRWHSDAITISNGNVPCSGAIKFCRFDEVGRNPIHIGFVDGFTISDNVITNACVWNGLSTSGNAVDVEVEGYDIFGAAPHWPYVKNLTIENNLIIGFPPSTSTVGINLQPAYGYLRNVIIRRNVVCGFQRSINVTGWLDQFEGKPGAADISVTHNWLTCKYDYNVNGFPILLDGCENFTFNYNVVNDLSSGLHSSSFSVNSIIAAFNSRNITMIGNVARGKPHTCYAFARLDGVDVGYLRDNSFQVVGGWPLWLAASHTNVVDDGGHTELSPVDWDKTAPTCQIKVNGDVVTVEADLDADRVFVLVDDLPIGFSDVQPYKFSINGEKPYNLTAFAIDHSANLSEAVNVDVKRRPLFLSNKYVSGEDNHICIFPANLPTYK